MKKILLTFFLVLFGYEIYANYTSAQEFFDEYNYSTEGKFSHKNDDYRNDNRDQNFNDVSIRGTKVTSGADYSCQLLTDGKVRCWGYNNQGALGDGTNDSSLQPKYVKADVKFKQLHSGDDFNCALDDGDDVYCWGSNERGQLGAGTKQKSSSTPVKLDANVKFRQVYTEAHYACALDENNYAYCWGDGTYGEVGNGQKGYFDTPQKVKTDIKFSRLTMSTTFVCGISYDKQDVYCWGQGMRGGNSKGLDSSVPVKI